MLVLIFLADTQLVNVNVNFFSVVPNVIIWFDASSLISIGAWSYGVNVAPVVWSVTISVPKATYPYFFFDALALNDTL